MSKMAATIHSSCPDVSPCLNLAPIPQPLCPWRPTGTGKSGWSAIWWARCLAHAEEFGNLNDAEKSRSGQGP